MSVYELNKQFVYQLSQALNNGFAELCLHATILEDEVSYNYTHDPIPKTCKSLEEAIRLAEEEWERVKHDLAVPTHPQEFDPDYTFEEYSDDPR